jgi:uncharacterized protein (TIGR03437 family)
MPTLATTRARCDPRPRRSGTRAVWTRAVTLRSVATALILLAAGSLSMRAQSLSAQPGSISFTYTIGGTAPMTQFISVTSPSSAEVTESTGSGCGWVVIGAISSNSPTTFNFAVDANTTGLAPGPYSCTITFNASGESSTTVQASLTVTGPSIAATPQSLQFNYQVGGQTPISQPISVTSMNPTSGVMVTSSLGSGCGWLNLSGGSGNTPSSASAGVNTSGLTPGVPYSCTITFSAAGATPISVQASLTVTQPTTLLVTPQVLQFNYQIGGPPPPSLRILVDSTNPSSGVAVTISTGSGCDWLTTSFASGTTPFSFLAGVNTANLSPGPYSCTITFAATGATSTFAQASLTVTQQNIIVASPSTLSFNYQIGGASPTPQSVLLTTNPMNGVMVASSLGGGCNWLTLSGGSGTTPYMAMASVNSTGLIAGPYSCTITFSATGAQNSPTVTATLSVTSPPMTTLSPSLGLLQFGTYQLGNPAPASQSLSVTSTNPASGVTFMTSEGLGCGWLNVPSGGTTLATLSISVNTSGLAANTNYSCVITLTASGVASAPTVTATLTTSANPPIITPASFPGGTAGVTYLAPPLTATQGTPPYKNWTVSAGSLPPGLSLDGGTGVISGTPTSATGSPFNFSVQVSDSAGVTSAAQPLSIAIAVPSVVVAPTSLNFVFLQESSAVPPPQSISVFGTSKGTSCNATASSSSGNWLVINSSAASGQTPFSIPVSVTVAGLGANTYAGQVTITCANSSPALIPVPVTLVVVPVTKPILSVTPPSFNFATVQGAPPIHGQITVSNVGGGTLQFTANAQGNCVSLGSNSGSATGSQAASISFTVDPSQLSVGVCSEKVNIQGPTPDQAATVGFTVAVSSVAQPSVIRLSQTGMEFTAGANAGPVPSQSFAILNMGKGSMPWSIQTTPLSGSVNWCGVSQKTGSSVAQALAPPEVSVLINPQGLDPGQYYCSIVVTSNGASNSPQTLSVLLNVVNVGTAPIVVPSGLIFEGTSGGPDPADQQITVYNLTGQQVSFTSTASTNDGGDWLSPTPATAAGIIEVGQRAQISAQAQLSALTPDIRQGVLRVAFSDGSVQTIGVTSVVTALGAPSVAGRLAPRQAGCTPSKLVVQFTSPADGFTVAALDRVPIKVLVQDDCDVPSTGAGVTASVTGQELPDPNMTSEGGGIYAVTWVPSIGPSRQVTVQVVAFGAIAVAGLAGGMEVSGTVSSNALPTAAAPGAVVNAASYQNAGKVAPGTFVSLFGNQLATEPTPGSPPYPERLGDAQVLLGPQPLRLQYVSAGQVNALVPLELPPNTIQQLLVKRGTTESVAVNVTLAEQEPGIFTLNSSGTGQGAILGPNNLVADSKNPVKVGDVIQIYCTGLGAVSNPPPPGTPAPAQPPLSMTLVTPTVTIGGKQATNVSFSGLAPGLVGLYQVNAEVPQGVQAGSAVNVILTSGTSNSNTATIAVK